MIGAIEAKRIADSFNSRERERAKQFAIDEINRFINPRIKKAASEGEYHVSYKWTKEVFWEKEFTFSVFEDVLIDLLTDFGYSVELQEIKGSGTIIPVEIKIWISWKEIEE